MALFQEPFLYCLETVGLFRTCFHWVEGSSSESMNQQRILNGLSCIFMVTNRTKVTSRFQKNQILTHRKTGG